MADDTSELKAGEIFYWCPFIDRKNGKHVLYSLVNVGDQEKRPRWEMPSSYYRVRLDEFGHASIMCSHCRATVRLLPNTQTDSSPGWKVAPYQFKAGQLVKAQPRGPVMEVQQRVGDMFRCQWTEDAATRHAVFYKTALTAVPPLPHQHRATRSSNFVGSEK